MPDPNPMEDFNAIAERALAAHAPNAVHQDTIARVRRLVPLLEKPAMPPDAPQRDSHGADLKP